MQPKIASSMLLLYCACVHVIYGNMVFESIQLHDAMSEFEQEKFELQKIHTRNIQDLLEETNSRLTKMEDEYAQQTQATVSNLQPFLLLNIDFEKPHCFSL